ncbi:MAG: hypothetical protein HYY14_01580 [Candidatus Omnitrophica bacterium]|nr:hypothetical protein [Candidatus Omnitrophota bacterium]
MTRYADIVTKSREQLIKDIEAGKILDPQGHLDPVGTLLYFNQLHHLDAKEEARRMLDLTVEIRDLTRTLRTLTVIVTILTLVNVFLVAYSFLR